MTKATYLAGPMTGIPQFNFPLFDRAAAALRARGLSIMSPAEMDDPETRRLAMLSQDGKMGDASPNGQTWGDFLARDVKLVADKCDSMILLPGWARSRGARLEAFVGLLAGYSFAEYIPERDKLIPVDRSYVLDSIVEVMR